MHGPDDYYDMVSNCFCRVHDREIQGEIEAEVSEGGGLATREEEG